jgi:hypothetical protein
MVRLGASDWLVETKRAVSGGVVMMEMEVEYLCSLLVMRVLELIV